MKLRNKIGVMIASKDKKITSSYIANKLGMTPSNFSNLKNGKTKSIKFETLKELCEILDCNIADILSMDNSRD